MTRRPPGRWVNPDEDEDDMARRDEEEGIVATLGACDPPLFYSSATGNGYCVLCDHRAVAGGDSDDDHEAACPWIRAHALVHDGHVSCTPEGCVIR